MKLDENWISKKKHVKDPFCVSRLIFQLTEDQDLPSWKEIICACQKKDLSLETSIEGLDKLADFYLENQRVKKGMKTVRQMDQLDA